MNCKNCEKYFSAYIDNKIDDKIDDKNQEQFKRHLENCNHCKDELAKFKKIVSLTTDLPVILPSFDFDRTLQAKLAEDESAIRYGSHYRWNFAFAITAICLFIAIAGLYVHNFLEHHLDSRHIIVDRQTVPMVSVNVNDNTIKHFVMPNIPTIQVITPVSSNKNVEKNDEIRSFVLPKVIYSSQNEQETDYVLEKVSFTDNNDKGYWR